MFHAPLGAFSVEDVRQAIFIIGPAPVFVCEGRPSIQRLHCQRGQNFPGEHQRRIKRDSKRILVSNNSQGFFVHAPLCHGPVDVVTPGTCTLEAPSVRLPRPRLSETERAAPTPERPLWLKFERFARGTHSDRSYYTEFEKRRPLRLAYFYGIPLLTIIRLIGD